MEATAELLKELNIKKVHRNTEDDDDLDDIDDEVQTQATTATGGSFNDNDMLSKGESFLQARLDEPAPITEDLDEQVERDDA